jgi:LysM repeat protein
MRSAVSLFGGLLLVMAGLIVSGCGPSLSQLDEEKEPHFLAGKSRVSAMDYGGAIECFEKALEVNPQSASAHFELACLFDRKDSKDSEPAEAIYHYNHYLKLRPNSENRELVKQHILTCKQELAQTVSLGPLTEKVQHQLEQLTDENKRVTEENKRLREDLDQWTAYARALQPLTNRAGALAIANRSSQTVPSAETVSTTTTAPLNSIGAIRASSNPAGSTRTHTIKAGDTPTTIARKYGIKVDALMSANPGLNAKRLQVGQSLSIPSS